MTKFLGVMLIVLALGIGILPQYTACQHFGKAITLANGKTVPMKCNWTAQAEIAVAVPIGIVGAASIFSKRKEGKRNLAIMGIILGAAAIALPTNLIGTCSAGSMGSTPLCYSVMKPSLIGMGALVSAGSLVGLVFSFRQKEPLA